MGGVSVPSTARGRIGGDCTATGKALSAAPPRTVVMELVRTSSPGCPLEVALINVEDEATPALELAPDPSSLASLSVPARATAPDVSEVDVRLSERGPPSRAPRFRPPPSPTSSAVPPSGLRRGDTCERDCERARAGDAGIAPGSNDAGAGRADTTGAGAARTTGRTRSGARSTSGTEGSSITGWSDTTEAASPDSSGVGGDAARPALRAERASSERGDAVEAVKGPARRPDVGALDLGVVAARLEEPGRLSSSASSSSLSSSAPSSPTPLPSPSPSPSPSCSADFDPPLRRRSSRAPVTALSGTGSSRIKTSACGRAPARASFEEAASSL